jgi:predicted Zn-dependent protease
MQSETKALIKAPPRKEGLWFVEAGLRHKWSLFAWGFALSLVFPPSVTGVFYSLWLLPMLFVGLVVRTHRALLYLQMGDRPLALQAAQAMIEESRDSPQELHHRLVYCHVLLECGEMDRAKEVLGTIDPQELTSPIDRVNYFQLLGNQLARLGDVEGLLAMTDAVEAECEDWGSTGDIQALMQNNRAVADILQGNLEEASRRLAELPMGEMGKMVRGVSLNNRAWVELRRGGDPISALEWATEALRLVPGKSAVQGTYGAALLETGADPRRALRFLEKPVENLELVPHQERAHVLFYAARALALLGKQQRAAGLAARMSGLPGSEALLEKLALLPA